MDRCFIMFFFHRCYGKSTVRFFIFSLPEDTDNEILLMNWLARFLSQSRIFVYPTYVHMYIYESYPYLKSLQIGSRETSQRSPRSYVKLTWWWCSWYSWYHATFLFFARNLKFSTNYYSWYKWFSLALTICFIYCGTLPGSFRCYDWYCWTCCPAWKAYPLPATFCGDVGRLFLMGAITFWNLGQ